MNSLTRILSISKKEIRLNLRFPFQYFINNLVTPIKTSVLMYLIYRGFLSGSDFNIGNLNKSNYQTFVLIGTTCHALFINCQGVFRNTFATEKYWQTLTAIFASPASIFEIVSGYALGNSVVHIAISFALLSVACLLGSIPLYNLLLCIAPILLLILTAFGIGIIGATISLVNEGKSYIYDYLSQAFIFLSCFYYPIDTLPSALRPIASFLPTYQASQIIQKLFIGGGFYHNYLASLLWLTSFAFATIIIASIILDKSLRRFGIVGY